MTNLLAVFAAINRLQEATPMRAKRKVGAPAATNQPQQLPPEPGQQAVPEPVPDTGEEVDGPAFTEDDAKALLLGVDDTCLLGAQRLKQLEDHSHVTAYPNRRMYAVDYTAGADFVYHSNRDYLTETHTFLQGLGDWGVGFDLDEIMEETLGRRPGWREFDEEAYTSEFKTFLAKIDDDAWEAFTDDLDRLSSYMVLDEQRMSDMEMEADSEFIESDGIKDLKKALAEKAECQDSFLQFVIEHITVQDVWHYLRVHDSYDFNRDEGSSWMDMKAYAGRLTVEEILGDDEGYGYDGDRIQRKVERLRQRFGRLKFLAFKHRLEAPLRAEVERLILEGDPELHGLLPTFQNFSQDTLFQLVLRAVPDANFADDDMPAWRQVAVKRPEHPVERHDDRGYWEVGTKYRTIWSVTAELPHKSPGGMVQYDLIAKAEAEGIAMLALDIIPKISGMAAWQAAQDPRQLKLAGFESLLRPETVAARLLEADGDDADDTAAELLLKADALSLAPTVTVYENEAVRIDEIRTFQGAQLVAPKIFDSEMEFDHLNAHYVILNAEAARPVRAGFQDWTVYLLPRAEEDGTSIGAKSARRTHWWAGGNLWSEVPVASAPMRDLVGHYLKDDPGHMLSVLYEHFGADALLPYSRLIRHFPATSALRLTYGAAAGKEGKRGIAKRALTTKTSHVDRDGVWIHVGDFDDLTGLFNRHQRDAATDVFNHEAWSWFDNYELLSIRDALGWLKPAHTKLVMDAMTGIEYTDDEGNEVVYNPAESMGTLTELLDLPEFEEVADAVRRAVDDAGQTARCDRAWQVWTQAALDAVGASRYKFIDNPAKPGGDMLALFLPWLAVDKVVSKALEDGRTSFTDPVLYNNDLADFVLSNAPEEAEVGDREDYWAVPEPEMITENLENHLPKAPGLPAAAEAPPVPPAPQQEALIAERVYGKSCLMLDLPPEHADAVQMWAKANIPEDRLYHSEKEDGYEDEPHITCIWGLLEPGVSDELRAIVEQTPVFTVRIGTVSLFENEEFDVVKLEVESPELHQLHARIRSSVPNKQTHPVYNPHVTLAYVRKGTCADLVGREVFSEDSPVSPEFEVETLHFAGSGDSDKPDERHVEVLPLDKTAEVQEGLPVDPFAGVGFAADPDRLVAKRRRPLARKRRARVLL